MYILGRGTKVFLNWPAVFRLTGNWFIATAFVLQMFKCVHNVDSFHHISEMVQKIEGSTDFLAIAGGRSQLMISG